MHFMKQLKEISTKNNKQVIEKLYTIWESLSTQEREGIINAQVKSLDRSVKKTSKYFGSLLNI